MTTTMKERSDLAAVLIPKLRLCVAERVTASTRRREVVCRIAADLSVCPSSINGWLNGHKNDGPPLLRSLHKLRAWMAHEDAKKPPARDPDPEPDLGLEDSAPSLPAPAPVPYEVSTARDEAEKLCAELKILAADLDLTALQKMAFNGLVTRANRVVNQMMHLCSG